MSSKFSPLSLAVAAVVASSIVGCAMNATTPSDVAPGDQSPRTDSVGQTERLGQASPTDSYTTTTLTAQADTPAPSTSLSPIAQSSDAYSQASPSNPPAATSMTYPSDTSSTADTSQAQAAAPTPSYSSTTASDTSTSAPTTTTSSTYVSDSTLPPKADRN